MIIQRVLPWFVTVAIIDNFCRVPYGVGDRRLACRGIAATARIGIDQRGFIAPMYLGTFGFGPGLNVGYSSSSRACTASGRCSYAFLDWLCGVKPQRDK